VKAPNRLEAARVLYFSSTSTRWNPAHARSRSRSATAAYCAAAISLCRRHVISTPSPHLTSFHLTGDSRMNTLPSQLRFNAPALTVIVAALALGTGLAYATETKVELTGSQEVPAVQTPATGRGTISVSDDKSVKGTVTTQDIAGIAAHIHHAPPGKNGPVIIPLEKSSANTWSVPEGAKLTDDQYAAYRSGELYVNVHSAKHKDGEIRGQIKP
jgi:CHRD domain